MRALARWTSVQRLVSEIPRISQTAFPERPSTSRSTIASRIASGNASSATRSAARTRAGSASRPHRDPHTPASATIEARPSGSSAPGLGSRARDARAAALAAMRSSTLYRRIPMSQVRSDDRPSKDARPRHAAARASCTASSARSADCSRRRAYANIAEPCRSSHFDGSRSGRACGARVSPPPSGGSWTGLARGWSMHDPFRECGTTAIWAGDRGRRGRYPDGP